MFSLNFSGNLSDAFFRQKNQVRCFSSVKFYRVFVGGAFCQKQLFLRRRGMKTFCVKRAIFVTVENSGKGLSWQKDVNEGVKTV